MQSPSRRDGSCADRLLRPHGGYRHLKSFHVAQPAYDVTVHFCDRYIDRRSRTHDQMVQAARSSVQNIAEGSKVSGTSKKMEIKLTNVAGASLVELRLDYEDFLRHRRMGQWERDDPRRQNLIERRCRTAEEVAQWVRATHDSHGHNGPSGLGGRTALSTKSTSSTRTPSHSEIAANGALALIAVASALLDRQVASQAADLEAEGGFTERLYRIRRALRDQGPPTAPEA